MTDEQPQRPTTDDREVWKQYWAKVQPPEWFERWGYWRTEPEIDQERQRFLAERRAVHPNIRRGIYPFRDENGSIKLTRSDMEWLLATHESRALCGPVRWDHEKDKQEDARRVGLDLRGADLSEASLEHLPLARLRGGTARFEVLHRTLDEGNETSARRSEFTAVHLERAQLHAVDLRGAVLGNAHLEGAVLREAHLESAYLDSAYLEGADLSDAHLEDATLALASLDGANLDFVHFERANLGEAGLGGAECFGAHMEGVNMEEADFAGYLHEADDLERIQKWCPRFPVTLTAANVDGAFFDAATNLKDTVLGRESAGFISVADVHWGGVNLAAVDWSSVRMLGNERTARLGREPGGAVTSDWMRLQNYEEAARATRQVAVELRNQGLNEPSDYFAYRAQVLQRVVLRRQAFTRVKGQPHSLWWRARKLVAYLGFWFLAIIAGYGYRPGRSILAYLLLVSGFAAAYYTLGTASGHPLRWYEALVVSLTAFHGRGFFAQQYAPGDPQSIIAAVEAVVGLLIEISFIATFTQRFFAR